MKNKTIENVEQGNKILTSAQVIVSVIVPILNEEKYIENCLNSILQQDFPKEKLEVVLVDGMSDDDTVAIINSYKQKYDFIHLYFNPNKTVQFALNIGIRNSQGIFIVRMDAHAEYATDYVSKCVEYLEKTDACNVGGPTIAIGKTNTQNAIAAAYYSPFALGGGKSHNEYFEGYADTVWPGAFKKNVLLSVGMYDESFPRNEDDELNYRIIKSGEKIFITPEIKCKYFPRSKLKDLFKQYFEYGLWKVAVIKKHKKPARLSHLIPISFVVFMLIFGVGSFFSDRVRLCFLSIMTLYLALNLFFSFNNKHIKKFKTGFLLIIVHFVIHISYGFGFLKGIISMLFKKKEKPKTF